MRPRGSLLAGTALLALWACGEPTSTRLVVCEEPKKPEVGHLSQCGPTADFTPINSYEGEFADVIQDTEDAVVLIDGRCTGTLIAASAGPVVLTAGHCVGLGDRSLLVFNFEDAPDGDPLVVEATVIERGAEPDYALLVPDELPAIRPVSLTAELSERLAIVQHPRGRRKVIAEGSLLGACNRMVYYADLDTLVGSSGAGVFNRRGGLVGVHTDGDCDLKGGGANWGWTAEAIVEASPYLVDTDLTGR
ncbi:MAG: trypsin-like peptidase domain-containing protein [Cystobacter sp.]